MLEDLKINYAALIVDGDFRHTHYIKGILERNFDNISVYIVLTPDAGYELLERTNIDIFIIDPALKGVEYSSVQFANYILFKDELTQIIFQAHITDLQFQAQLHKKFGNSPYIRKSSLRFEDEMITRAKYALTFVSKHDPRKLFLKKKSESFCFDIREIIYVFRMPNEKSVVVKHWNFMNNQIVSTLIPNTGLVDVVDALQIKQDLIRIQDSYLINPLMVLTINHRTSEVLMKDGKTSIRIGKTFRDSIGIVLNALLT